MNHKEFEKWLDQFVSRNHLTDIVRRMTIAAYSKGREDAFQEMELRMQAMQETLQNKKELPIKKDFY